MLPPRADVHLLGMTDRPRRARKPLITSTVMLRTLATAITLSSFGGMTMFASENLYTSDAPLQPAAVAVAVSTPAPTTLPTTITTSRTTVRSSVASTTTAAITRTKQS
jgi:hypothetical protein